MEASGLVIAACRDVAYVFLNHLLLSLVGSFILTIILIRFYCRLSVGICECDQDMKGKTVLITGATAGIGKATAIDLARRHARVIITCRDVRKGESVAKEISKATGNHNISVKYLQLDSFESVRQCAEEILRTESKLHVLINNAGIYVTDSQMYQVENEIFMQTNHFGHFLLTLMLLELIKKSAPSRIINVSSGAYVFGELDPENINACASSSISSFKLYARSKLANILFTRELASRLKNTGVTVNALEPGAVNSDIFRPMNIFSRTIMKTLFFFFAKSVEEGAQTAIYLAVHPEVEHVTGKYFCDCKEKPLTGLALDDSLASALFEKSEEAVGYKYV